MLNRIKNRFQSLLPSTELEEISLETRTVLETIFFKIIDGSIKFFANVKIERGKKSVAIDFFLDLIYISLILEMVTQTILLLPSLVASGDPYVGVFSIQLVVITLFCAISWTGYVYLNDDFRKFVKAKIIPVLEKYGYTIDTNFYGLFRQFFNGVNLKWQSGFSLRFHWRTVFYLAILLLFCLTSSRIIGQLFSVFFQTPTVITFLSLVLGIFSFIIVALFVLIFTFTLLTIIAIFFCLFVSVTGLNIELNPLIEMSGTQKYGEIIVKSLFLLSFVFASFPALLILTKIKTVPTIEFSQFSNLTFGNISTIINDKVVKTVNEAPINTLSEYYSIFLLFFFFVVAAIVIIFILHYRIKQRKLEELQNIENQLSKIDFLQISDPTMAERHQYFLSLHERISNSYEWPIKRIFVIELMLAVLPLLVSHFL